MDSERALRTLERRGLVAFRFGGDDRGAAVPRHTDAEVQGDFAEERHAETLGLGACAAMAERVMDLAAAVADEGGHVLDDAENGRFHPLEHVDALLGIDQRNVLRRGDHDCTGNRDLLRQGQLGITCTGRQVDDEVIEVLPVGVVEQLLERLGDIGPRHIIGVSSSIRKPMDMACKS